MIPKARLMTSSSTTASNKSMVVIEKPSSQEPLKCPRCDSSNTKFCYYNNYSLSQPRHFCKACKRYWTRGGTLRNVPVGGSCRKNNRVKHRQPGGGDVASTAVAKAATTAGNPSLLRPRVDLSHSSSISNSSLLYGLSSAANNMNSNLEFGFPFPGLSSTKVSSDNSSGLLDMNLHHVTDLGIGFSSPSGLVRNHNLEFSNGFKNFIQDHSNNNNNNPSSSSSSLPVFNNPILFGSSSAFSPSTSATMASLLASTIQHQQKYANNGDLKDIETRSSNLHQGLVASYHGDKSTQENESGWNSNPNSNSNHQYHIPQINPSDSNSSLLWNPSNVSSAWFDPSNNNMGSSVPSLIN